MTSLWRHRWWAFVLWMAFLPMLTGAPVDKIEFLNGLILEGKVVALDPAARQVQFEAEIAGARQSRKYQYERIHAVTWNGTRHVLTAKPSDRSSATAVAPGGTRRIERTPAEVRAIIDKEGGSPPEWFASTPLEFPKSLDLNWPEPPPPPWNNQKNVGQYVWDRINPNANKWQSGVRLMYHLLALHRNNRRTSERAMESLGLMYFQLFQDYPRAAYWWEKAGVSGGEHHSAALAECYFRLGNVELAGRQLRSTGASPAKVKLLGEMGEIDEALRLANAYGASAIQPHEYYLVAGDVCRSAGRFQQAIAYYRKVIDGPDARNEDYGKRYRGRAEDSIEAINRFELLDIGRLPDGAYQGTSLGYEAPVKIEATVNRGRITRLEVIEHREKQYYSALRDVPNQIIQKQSVKDVDATSRATITAVAIINATAKALTDKSARPR